MENKPVNLNEALCRKIGQTVAKLSLRDDFYKREFLNAKLDEETKFRMEFFAVAICHQTHNLHHPGLNLWGWDYLEHAYLNIAKTNPKLIDPAFLTKISAEDLKTMLRPFFSPDSQPENCTLDRLDERVRLMFETSGFIMKKYKGLVGKMMKSTGQRLFNNGNGVYEIMVNMETFSDTMQKKSTFLVKLLEESELLNIQDPENFIPIMDYHMQRVLMRLGCVEIIDEQLHKQLVNRTPIESDAEIRSACIDAFNIISKVSEFPVTKMNDFFWSLGRSCCGETTLCREEICEKTPCTLTQIVDIKNHSRCIFESNCKGSTDNYYRNLWQPVIDTHFY